MVRVIAVNDEGDGSPSAEATGVLRQTTPPQMVVPKVNSANLKLQYDGSLEEHSVPAGDAFYVRVTCLCYETRWQDAEASVPIAGDTLPTPQGSAHK